MLIILLLLAARAQGAPFRLHSVSRGTGGGGEALGGEDRQYSDRAGLSPSSQSVTRVKGRLEESSRRVRDGRYSYVAGLTLRSGADPPVLPVGPNTVIDKDQSDQFSSSSSLPPPPPPPLSPNSGRCHKHEIFRANIFVATACVCAPWTG